MTVFFSDKMEKLTLNEMIVPITDKIQQPKQQQKQPQQQPRLSVTTRTAFYYTGASLLLLLFLSFLTNQTNDAINDFIPQSLRFKDHGYVHRRSLSSLQDASNDDANNSGDTDFSQYSCSRLYEVTPNAGSDQCTFAHTCNQGDGVWGAWVFCSYNYASAALLSGLFCPFVLIWLVLLFRMLGSTAEDYFSPSLEMFSMELGLPPRFAGVTLLALGNGAADVSATVSAITSDAQHGYELSLGALTGAAMFITAIISSLVVLTAGGVNCRGALVRDVTALLVTVLVVWHTLDQTGSVGPETITLFLSLYATFVILVLVADVYHRAVVVPRLTERAQQAELQRQVEEGRLQRASLRQFGQESLTDLINDDGNDDDDGIDDDRMTEVRRLDTNVAGTDAPPNQPHRQQTMLVPPSTSDTTRTAAVPPSFPSVVPPRLPQRRETSVQSPASSSLASSQQSSVMATGAMAAGAVLAALSNYDTVDGTSNYYDQQQQHMTDPTIASSGEFGNAASGGGGGGDGWGVESDDLVERPIMLHGTHGLLHQNGRGSSAGFAYGSPSSNPAAAAAAAAAGDYTMLEDSAGMACVEPGSPGMPASSWRSALIYGKHEVQHVFQTIWEDIVWNGDVHPLDKFFLILEYPVTILRKVTVPIPCEGFYVRGLVALSLAVSPLWFAYYLSGHGVNILHESVWMSFLLIWLAMIVVALVTVRYAPGGEGNMSMMFAVPIALYGFVLAATWIDTIADTLVGVLNFIGIIMGIPSPVLGLTLLAWGNSMSDLSANLTMARKGLANMAMTACFAGPVFNILVGLGLGFSSLAAETGVHERAVSLSPSVLTGFLFVGLNAACILSAGLAFGKGRIHKRFGYVSIALYSVYVISSISLQYSRYGNNQS